MEPADNTQAISVNAYRTKTGVIAVIAIALMITCCLAPAVNSAVGSDSADMTGDSGKSLKYVALGDSMTAGYGMSGYYEDDTRYGFLAYDTVGTYPQLLTEYLEGKGYVVDFEKLTISGSRTTDIRSLIDPDFTGKDDIAGDAYTAYTLTESGHETSNLAEVIKMNNRYSEFVNDHQGLDDWDLVRAFFCEQLSSADIVTYNAHMDFGHALSEVIQAAISGEHLDPEYIDADFSLYMNEDIVDAIEYLKVKLIEFINSAAEMAGIDISRMTEIVDNLVTYVKYSVLGYCANMDAISGWLYEHNPGVKFVIIETYNILTDLDINILGNLKISLSDIYGLMLDFCRLYTEYLSPYADRNYYVETDGTPTMLGYEFTDCEESEITDDAKAAIISSINKWKYDYDDYMMYVGEYDRLNTWGHLYEFLECVMSSKDCDLSFILSGGLNDFQDRLNEKTAQVLDIIANEGTVVSTDADGGLTASYGEDEIHFERSELTVLSVLLISLQAHGILAHPSAYGHRQIEECIEKTFEEQDVLGDE